MVEIEKGWRVVTEDCEDDEEECFDHFDDCFRFVQDVSDMFFLKYA